MKLDLIVVALAAIGFVVLILCSKVLRTMFRESILRPKASCDIHVGHKHVRVVRHHKGAGKEA